VDIYVAEVANDIDTVTTWTTLGTGRVASYSIGLSSNEQSINFQLIPFRLPDKPLTLEVSRTIAGMENAPDGSLGRALPLVLNRRQADTLPPGGYQEVVPIRISEDGDPEPVYALSTVLYGKTSARLGPGYIYIKPSFDDGERAWQLYDLAGRDAPKLQLAFPTSTASYYSLQTYAAMSFQIPSAAAPDGAVLTQIAFTGKGNGYAGRPASNGFISGFIQVVNKLNKQVVAEIGRGKVPLSLFDSLNNAGTPEFSVVIDLDKPVFIPSPGSSPKYDYYIGFEASGADAADLSLVKYNGAAGSPFGVLYRPNTGSGGNSYNDWIATTDTMSVAYFTDTVRFMVEDWYGYYASSPFPADAYTADGLSYTRLRIDTPFPASGQVAPSWDDVQMVVLMDGSLVGDETSTRFYRNPVDLCNLLSLEWSGTAWVDAGYFDTTSLSASHYTKLFEGTTTHRGRCIAGMFEGTVKLGDALTQIGRGIAGRFGIFPNGKMFLYPWGVTVSPAYDIPYSDILPISWDVRDESTVVNDINLFYDKKFAVRDDEGGYGSSVSYALLDSLAFDTITEESAALFGNRPLADSKLSVYGYGTALTVNDYGVATGAVGVPNYLGGGYADFLAEYYVSRFAKPLVYCSFVVPYHRYKNIKMFDVITFTHPDFPAFWGTDPEPRTPPVNTGTSVVPVPNANKGHELIRAQMYRGLVEGVTYVLAMEHAPVIRLTVQVLLNKEYDPT
jgi:hypothetical protein